jgi:hypothetical protein
MAHFDQVFGAELRAKFMVESNHGKIMICGCIGYQVRHPSEHFLETAKIHRGWDVQHDALDAVSSKITGGATDRVHGRLGNTRQKRVIAALHGDSVNADQQMRGAK